LSQRKDGDSETCVEATDALSIYSRVDTCEKAKFLKDFIDNGGGKGKDDMQFRYTYNRTIARAKEEKIAVTENDLNRHE